MMIRRSLLNEFVELISNVMESYTTILFLPDEKEGDILKIKAFYSLGKNIKEDCLVRSGEGIIGWVFREQKSVLAASFDKRDATTLKFYTWDEEIKSLLAIPLPKHAGVLCVDSKKSYRFTKEREKILRQMGAIIVSLLHDEEQLREKRKTDKYLSFSLKFAEIFVDCRNRDDLVEQTLRYLLGAFGLHLVLFLSENDFIYFLAIVEKKLVFKKENYSFFDPYGLCGWVIRNNKELLLEKIAVNDHSYLINKNEEFEQFHNFFGIPVSFADHKGLLSFGKRKSDKWSPREIKLLSLFSSLLFKEYQQKK